MEEEKIMRSFGTHDGSFHADEVTACALLMLFDLIDQDKVVRTRDPNILETCEFVCDVGGVYDPSQKLFDHHQAEFQGELSSAGMILLYLKEENIINEKEFLFFRDTLVLGVDEHDNGKDPQIKGYCTYSHVIANFRPVLYDPPSEEETIAFHKALDFAFGHLKRMRERFLYILSCEKIVQKAMDSSEDCLFFDEGIPWLESFFELGGANHPAKYVIVPSGGHWNLRCIPPSYAERMKVRHPLPEEWAGLLEEDLKRVSGIDGAIFCHKGRFISVWETKEDAIKALNEILGRL